MSKEHLALVVEDEEPISSALVEILLAANCQTVVAAHRDAAKAALDKHNFCIVLLDLKMKANATANRAHTVHGQSVLHEVRKRHQEHTGVHFWLPVLIVSGYAGEYDLAVDVLKHGAHDVIVKPFKPHEVVDKVQATLAACGRSAHEQCAVPAGATSLRSVAAGEIVIEIPGGIVKRKARVLVNAQPLLLEPRMLEFLLRLLVGHAQGKLRHRSELGAGEGAFRLPSALRNEVSAKLGVDVDVIRKDERGSFGLATNVRIGACDTKALEQIGERQITKVARELRALLDAKKAS